MTVAVLFHIIPFFASLSIVKFNELRLFFLSETMTKQQQVVLEILGRQNDGVIIL